MTRKIFTLNKYKKEIADCLKNFLTQEKHNLAKINLHDDVFKTLTNFLLRGKMSRANLLILTSKVLQTNFTNASLKKVLPFASALELIQAGLLIHDDIIDQDQQRRGQNSIWQYYALQNSSYDQNYGKNQAICMADLTFFLANQLIVQGCTNLNPVDELNKDELRDQKSLNIQQLINREISQVIMAEMLDVQLAINDKLPSLKQIMEMNLYKTARYSFSLPLILAGYLADQPPATLNKLSQIGEKIGLIFQIQDDYLGIFGDSKKTGKPILSDIREGKKTMFYYYLINSRKLDTQAKQLLDNCFASHEIKTEDGLALQKLFKSHSLQLVNSQLKQLKQETLDKIDQLNNKQLQKLLRQILTLAQNRQQ
jgi:geranylgeranyl diphosphate synthase, type I